MVQHIMGYKHLSSFEFLHLLPDRNQRFLIIRFHREARYQVLDLCEPCLKLFKKVLILLI